VGIEGVGIVIVGKSGMFGSGGTLHDDEGGGIDGTETGGTDHEDDDGIGGNEIGGTDHPPPPPPNRRRRLPRAYSSS